MLVTAFSPTGVIICFRLMRSWNPRGHCDSKPCCYDIPEELDLSGARTKLVILDACRNNPFVCSTRGGGRGLAAVDAAQGTLIAYATATGATAADGEGENGLYTASLIKAIREPGLKVEEVFKKTRIDVSAASGGDQVPLGVSFVDRRTGVYA